MVHLGSYKDLGQTLGAVQVVEALEETLKGYKGTTQLLVEISAGAGEIIGDTFEEIAEIQQSKESTVKMRFYRAIEKLKAEIA